MIEALDYYNNINIDDIVKRATESIEWTAPPAPSIVTEEEWAMVENSMTREPAPPTIRANPFKSDRTIEIENLTQKAINPDSDIERMDDRMQRMLDGEQERQASSVWEKAKAQQAEPAESVDSSLPRGIRNNNPGNIEQGENWKGSVEGADTRFVTFDSPEMGVRALNRILNTYKTKHKLNTVEGIINRWAPPVENDTDSYVNSVSRAVGVGRDEQLRTEDRLGLIKAIIKHENGVMPYSDEVIKKGIRL